MTTVLIEYMFLILGSTVIYRASGEIMRYELVPFWSYAAIHDGGHNDLIKENLLNVALGIPIGLYILTQN